MHIQVRKDTRFDGSVFIVTWGARRVLLSMPKARGSQPPSDDECRAGLNECAAHGDTVAGPLNVVWRMDEASALK